MRDLAGRDEKDGQVSMKEREREREKKKKTKEEFWTRQGHRRLRKESLPGAILRAGQAFFVLGSGPGS
jgi:hypothetical protein